MSVMRERRVKKGLSRKTLGDMVGVSERHIAFIEAGDREPSLEVALKISSALKMSVEKIFGSVTTKSTS